jgi:hypothetical protein
LNNFVTIPPSGESWKAVCLRRGIEYRPVAGFDLQTRPVSKSQFRDLDGDVATYSLIKDLNWDSEWIFDNWEQAVNWAGSLSSQDLQFEYRLPTTYEWLYAYDYAKTLGVDRQSGPVFDDAKGYEFATDYVLDIPLPISESVLPSLANASFVMGIPHHVPAGGKGLVSTASPIHPGGGDDGIDEVTYLRLVRLPQLTGR